MRLRLKEVWTAEGGYPTETFVWFFKKAMIQANQHANLTHRQGSIGKDPWNYSASSSTYISSIKTWRTG
jgi:hypothetical protein